MMLRAPLWASPSSSSSILMAWSQRTRMIRMQMRWNSRRLLPAAVYDHGTMGSSRPRAPRLCPSCEDNSKSHQNNNNNNRRRRRNAMTKTRGFLRPSSWSSTPPFMFGTARQCTIATSTTVHAWWWPTVSSSISSSISSSPLWEFTHHLDVTNIRVRWQHSATTAGRTAADGVHADSADVDNHGTDVDTDATSPTTNRRGLSLPNDSDGKNDMVVSTTTTSSATSSFAAAADNNADNNDASATIDNTTTTVPTTSSTTHNKNNDLHDIWHRRTRRLLDQPIGTLEDQTWNEAFQILKYWFSNSRNSNNLNQKDGSGSGNDDDREEENNVIISDENDLEEIVQRVDKCFAILDRLYQEQEEGKKTKTMTKTKKLANDSSKEQSPRISTMEILNPILKLWRRAFKTEYAMRGTCNTSNSPSSSTTTTSTNESSSRSIFLPSAVAERLKQYEDVNLVRADGATYTMILDAASHCTVSLPEEEGLLFADQYLQDWFVESDKGLRPIKPDLVAAGTVVHAWAESDHPSAAFIAESWAEQAIAYIPVEEGMLPGDRSILYTTVMSAWAKAGDPAKAQYWMDQLEEDEHSPSPDITAWSTLLMALANADSCEYPKAAMRAEDVLQQMQELHRSGKLKDPPNVVSYSLVMEAWNRRSRKNPESANRAHMWLHRMKTNGVAPNTVSYNTVISSHVRAGNLRQAERLFEDMMKLKNDDISPDVRTFTSLLAGLSSVGTVQSAERAESLLKMMRKRGIVPTTRIYSSCISCWAHVAAKAKPGQKRGAVKRAQMLFHNMKQVDKLDPDVYVYTSLLNAYGKGMQSRNAQKLLDAYLAEYKASGQEKLKPTVQTFSTVMSAWSQYHHPDAAENAHALLLQMERDFDIEPNVYCYSAVLGAYANSPGLEEAVDSAARLFAYLRSDATSVEPNRFCYNAMIRVLANAGRAEEAEKLLDEMLSTKRESEESSNGQRIVRSKPNAYTFGSVLQAWSKSHDPFAGERAEQLLRRMQDLYRSQIIDEPPNMVCYTTVMTCWAHSSSPDGAQRAEDWLRMMQQENIESMNSNNNINVINHERLRPNRIAYNIVINGWANHGDLDRVDALMEELHEASRFDPKLTPDEYSYRAVWKAIQNSKQMNLSLEDRLTRLAELVKAMSEIGMTPTTSMQEDLDRYSRELAEEASTIK